MSEFSDRVEAISISGIREVFEAAGDDAINLGIGQPDFPTPDHARRGAIEAIENEQVDAYTANKGIEGLRQGIVAKHERELGVDGVVVALPLHHEMLHIRVDRHVRDAEFGAPAAHTARETDSRRRPARFQHATS